MAICRDVTEKNGIAVASVASKKDIDGLVAGATDSKLNSGWRYEMLGQTLLKFLHGEIRLSCAKQRLTLS